MSERPPEFDDLVGPDLDARERERLRRVHDLLVAAGPPPETSGQAPSMAEIVRLPQRRRRTGFLALAAALGIVAAFALGLALADADDPSPEIVIAMSGPSGATASLEVFEVDDAGNWPMQVEVEGLKPSADGRLFQLWLTKNGKPAALCGSFLAEPDGTTVVPMNAPWHFEDFDGWVVVEAGSEKPVLTT